MLLPEGAVAIDRKWGQDLVLEHVTQRPLRWLAAFILAVLCAWTTPALAATCSAAASQGTAPSAWQTYCWLDFSTYNDATARSASGQNFSYTLSDGAVLSFNLKATSTAASAATATAAPSWTGAAVGNSAFIGIPGMPILYMTNSASTVTFTISSILITPPAGVSAVSAYAFVAADAESTDNAETLSFGTNGTSWVVLDQVNPITGSQYPTATGAGTATFTESGGGLTGNVGGYIVGSNSPTTVTASMTGQGLQGMMFAVRFASLRLTKQINGARVDATDQFAFKVTATSSGATLAAGQSSGATNGPFAAAAVSFASGIPVTLSEAMVTGSASTLARYNSSLTCTNGTSGSSTVLPSNLIATSYNLGALQFGDALQCMFTNTAFPHIKLQKALGAGGRLINTDQFVMNLNQGATTIATTTTTGTGATVTTGATPLTQVTAGTAYSLNEVAAGTTTLAQYVAAMTCSNAATGSTTTLPTTVGGTITPVLGDVVTCTITNTKKAANATLTAVKYSTLISDPINGTTNPKMIPGAVVRYFISITNTGTLAVDASTIVITDALPTTVTYDASSPVQFSNGTPASGLNAFVPATMVTFSGPGSATGPYTYSPATAGYDANVKGVRIAPTGIMAGATTAGQPSFTVSFLTRIN
jgi:Surface adhesin CshA non-repetitive domain 2